MTLTNKTKQIIIYESCKCTFRLNPIVCNNKQKWNEDKCTCECLVNKECNNNQFLNPSNCECEYRTKAAYLTEQCEEIIDNEAVSISKTITTLDSCKRFVASSVLFLSVSALLTGVFIYFYFKSPPPPPQKKKN